MQNLWDLIATAERELRGLVGDDEFRRFRGIRAHRDGYLAALFDSPSGGEPKELPLHHLTPTKVVVE